MWNLIGNEQAVSLIFKSFTRGVLSHAYLLSGPPKVGKMTLAVNIAQLLKCERFSVEGPCGECSSCSRILSDNHPDVQIISERPEAKYIGIQDLIDIQRNAILKSFEGGYRIFIFPEAGLLTPDASNTLLKLLEEPPDEVLFLLVTNQKARIHSTIVSRCQVIELGHLPSALIEKTIHPLLDGNTRRANELARLSGGRIGWALEAATNPNVLDDYKSDIEFIEFTMNGNLEERFEYAAKISNLYLDNREKAINHLNILMNWWRDLMVVKNGLEEYISNIFSKDVLEKYSRWFSHQEVIGVIKQIEDTLDCLQENVNPRLVLESLVLAIPRTRSTLNGRCK